MKSRTLVTAVVVVLAGAGVYWLLARRPARVAPADAATQAVDAWLALRIQILSAGPDDDVIVTATAYDRRARQAAMLRDATGGRWRGSGPAPREPHPLPEGWAGRLRLSTANGAPVPATVVSQGQDGHATLRIARDAMPAGATSITAVLTYDAGEARSNAASIVRAPLAPADRLVALGHQAELLGDVDRLAGIGADLIAQAPASPWGHYFTGAAHEARGGREAAIAAFRKALALTTPGFEPPIGLVVRIKRLGG